MDILKLKEIIIDEPSYIETILESIPLYNIKEHFTEFRCGVEEDTNPTSIAIKKDSLSFIYRHSQGEVKGDILTLVGYFKDYELPREIPKIINYICKTIGIENEKTDDTPKYSLFGGYFNKIKPHNEYYNEIETFDNNILNNFTKSLSRRFFNDNINYMVQKEFEVMLDENTNRICYPWRDIDGRIVGVVGRICQDSDWCNKYNIPKYKPIIPPVNFPKSKVLFGLYQNFKYINESKTLLIFEAEKSVMQLASFEKPIADENGEIISYQGIRLGTALGSHGVSPEQRRIIHSLYPERVILCFDEGIEEKVLIETCNYLQYEVSYYKMEIGYIYDDDNKYLPKGSKYSPSDKGQEVFENLIIEKVRWI